EPGPDELDLLRLTATERRCRGLGKPRRYPDAQPAGHKLEQRPAAGLVELIEPARELAWKLGLAELRKRFDDGGEREGGRRLSRWHGSGRLRCRPHQRDRLGKIADIII